MSISRNIQSSALFALPFIGYQPVNISNGEPAITAANLTKQTLLGPPMKWPWNRGDFHIDLDIAMTAWPQDYQLDLADFGFVERVWLTDPFGTKKEITTIAQSLSGESIIKRPSSVAMQNLYGDGTATLRLNTCPDLPYSIDGCYQRAPKQMYSLANSWYPIPDHLGFIYDWGFLGFVSLLTKDARSGVFLSKFVSHLLGAQDGLTAVQRNLFLGNFLELTSQVGREQMSTQQGAMARSNG